MCLCTEGKKTRGKGEGETVRGRGSWSRPLRRWRGPDLEHGVERPAGRRSLPLRCCGCRRFDKGMEELEKGPA